MHTVSECLLVGPKMKPFKFNDYEKYTFGALLCINLCKHHRIIGDIYKKASER